MTSSSHGAIKKKRTLSHCTQDDSVDIMPAGKRKRERGISSASLGTMPEEGTRRLKKSAPLMSSDEEDDHQPDSDSEAEDVRADASHSKALKTHRHMKSAKAKPAAKNNTEYGDDNEDNDEVDYDDGGGSVGNNDEENDGEGPPLQTESLVAGSRKKVKISNYFELETNTEKQKRRKRALESLRNAHSKAKIRTLGQLELPSENEAREILRHSKSAIKVSTQTTDACVTALCSSLPGDYFAMQQGFNILVHGFGSKKRVLEGYAAAIKAYESARNYPLSCVMVIAGYSATINLRSALGSIMHNFLGLPESESFKHSRTVEAMSALIVELTTEVARRPKVDLTSRETKMSLCQVKGYTLAADAPVWSQQMVLIVHNIDGKLLRGTGPCKALSMLAESPQVHIVASVDHIAAELLWDPKQLERFRWIWREVHTYESYLFEGIGAPSLVRGQDINGSRGAAFVLSSLTPNHISVLEVIADYQIDLADIEGSSTALHGMEFGDLLNACRDQMFVSTERALRSLLVEFKDHNILSSRITPDGKELLFITLDPSVIKREISKINNT